MCRFYSIWVVRLNLMIIWRLLKIRRGLDILIIFIIWINHNKPRLKNNSRYWVDTFTSDRRLGVWLHFHFLEIRLHYSLIFIFNVIVQLSFLIQPIWGRYEVLLFADIIITSLYGIFTSNLVIIIGFIIYWWDLLITILLILLLCTFLFDCSRWHADWTEPKI